MIQKLHLSLLVFITELISIALVILSNFYIGLTAVGLWDVNKIYIPLAILLLLIDKVSNKEVNKRIFVSSVVSLVILILLMIIVIN